MSQIRSDILYHHQKKQAKKANTKIQHLHLATPIVEDDNLNNPEFDNLSENDLQISDNDNDLENEKDNNNGNKFAEPHTEEQEQEWNTCVKEWIIAIEQENKFDNTEDEILLTDEMNNDFNFGEKSIHPADDLTAKWPLATLFVSDLNIPTYL